MKNVIKFLFLFLLMMFTLSGCTQKEENVVIAEKIEAETETNIIEYTLNNMTITEKIGQMMMIGIYGYDIDENIAWMLHQYHCGGIILFDRNMDTKAQVKQLIDNVQNQAEEKVPLFFAIDEEGGTVARMKHEIEPAPSQEKIGNSGDTKLAKMWSINISKELKLLGININFAPVADIGSPDTRSFSSEAEIVTNFVDSAARGYEEQNMIYCLKHFPGIGKRITDPHQEISSINVSRETLETEDILPFKNIIQNHANDKFMIMVSHLKYPAIDESNSATLSYEVMTNLLRKDLNYDGIIITDDLEMGAISNHNTFKEAAVKAVKAGADIVLVCHDYSHEQEAYFGILEAVQNGEINEERINESIRRILKVKLNNLTN